MTFANYPMIEKLCALGSLPLAGAEDLIEAHKFIPVARANAEQLVSMLRIKNGFYAFESALHVFPLVVEDRFHGQDLWRWNSQTVWKHSYGETLQDVFCFAEDVFAYQFCLVDNSVRRFDPETGEIEKYCNSVEQWAEKMCTDFNVSTGYPVAREWQALKGPLGIGNRLVPIYPFVSKEGTYEISNLYELDSAESLAARASFAKQIAGIHDGEKIRLVSKKARPQQN